MVTIAILTLLGCSDSESKAEPTSGTLSVLTYNIHGLPPEVTGDDTTGRIEQITPLLSDYDVVGLQEDWIAENRSIWIDGSGFENIDIFDEELTEDKVYGSGLSLVSQIEHVATKHVFYDGCNGYIDSASDCFASKGVQVVSSELGGESCTSSTLIWKPVGRSSTPTFVQTKSTPSSEITMLAAPSS